MFNTGLLFPEDILHTDWFGAFATLVAINTLIYVVLGVSKLLPVIHLGRRRGGRNRRGETRSIYPDAEG